MVTDAFKLLPMNISGTCTPVLLSLADKIPIVFFLVFYSGFLGVNSMFFEPSCQQLSRKIMTMGYKEFNCLS